GVLVGHAGDDLEPARDVALSHESIEREIRGVALQTRARLLAFGDPARLLLVEEAVEVPAAIAVVEGERVPGEDASQPRLLVELLLGGPGVPRAEATAAVLGRSR